MLKTMSAGRAVQRRKYLVHKGGLHVQQVYNTGLEFQHFTLL